jgi:hypothetical protein
MARRRPAKDTPQQRALLTTRPYAAGIDLGLRLHVVAVPPALAPEPVRTYQSFPEDLPRMADWLVNLGITTVAMESTGIYWIPAFEMLEARGRVCGQDECLDNAVAERFFGSFKGERTAHRRYDTRQDATNDVIDYIEMFYN